MTVTFLVAIDIPDITDLPGIAQDIDEDLRNAGHDVQSVAPWARPTIPTAQPSGGFTTLTSPPPASI